MSSLQQINPFIRYCALNPRPTETSHFVKAYDCRVFYILSGEGCFFVGEEAYEFRRFSLVYIPSGVEYRFHFDPREPIQLLILNFDLTSEHTDIRDPITPDNVSFFKPSRLITAPDLPYYTKPFLISSFESGSQGFLSIHHLFVSRVPFHSEIASGILKKLLMQVVSDRHAQRVSPSTKIADQVLAYVRSHYAEPITNQAIASYFSFHPYYLNRVIKAATGQTLHAYLIHCRIRAAQSLLTTTASPVHGIALSVGFGTPSQFSSAFKKETGLSPSEYREMYNRYI